MAHIQYVCTDEGNAHNRMCIMMIWSEHIRRTMPWEISCAYRLPNGKPE